MHQIHSSKHNTVEERGGGGERATGSWQRGGRDSSKELPVSFAKPHEDLLASSYILVACDCSASSALCVPGEFPIKYNLKAFSAAWSAH